MQRIHLIAWLLLLCSFANTPRARPLQETTPEVAAAPRSIEDLIREGRTHLDARDPELALPLFERAAELDGESVETRIWILRAWMDAGRSNDTLDAIDELRRAGLQGPKLDYLYGMAFARRAQKLIGEGVTDSSPQMNFLDAVEYLERALAAYPLRFRDAHHAMAIAAWFTQDLERARKAAEQAVAVRPGNSRAWLQLGRIAMSQFSTAQQLEEWSNAASAHYERALVAFERAIEGLGRPLDDADEQRLLSAAGLQLGNARLWKSDHTHAADAYAIGIAWAPQNINYKQIQQYLTPYVETDVDSSEEPGVQPPSGPSAYFHRAIEEGARRFHEAFGEEDARDSSLWWWLGWSRLQHGYAARSEAAFLTTLEKTPEFVNAWFYLAMARFDQGAYGPAAEAIEAGWEADPNVILASVEREKEINTWKLGKITGELRSGEPYQTAETNRRCAILAELIAEATPRDPWGWNNMGMFLRDTADSMRWSDDPKPDPAALKELYERAYVAYQRSIKLLPDDPGIINDTALMLHYYLDRDWEAALVMYQRSTELAEKMLADPGLDEDERSRIETVLMDSVDNYRLLRKLMASRNPSSAQAAEGPTTAVADAPQAGTQR